MGAPFFNPDGTRNPEKIQTNHGGTRAPGGPRAPGAVGAPYSSPLLNERETTHGDYPVTAIISQFLKRFFREQGGWEKLSELQRESFDAIAIKIARILSGNPNEEDHWVDIRGYADLIVAHLIRKNDAV